MERLRQGLQSPDPALVADLVYYPLRVSAPDSTWYVGDRDQLIGAFEWLFPPELRERVIGLDLDDLLATSRGVAVAAGLIWIGEACASNSVEPCPPAIFELERRGPPGP